jgi:hypothetical protein
VPAIGKLTGSGEGSFNLGGVQKLLAFASRERGRNFNRCSPPSKDFRVFSQNLEHWLSRRFIDKQWDDR